MRIVPASGVVEYAKNGAGFDWVAESEAEPSTHTGSPLGVGALPVKSMGNSTRPDRSTIGPRIGFMYKRESWVPLFGSSVRLFKRTISCRLAGIRCSN